MVCVLLGLFIVLHTVDTWFGGTAVSKTKRRCGLVTSVSRRGVVRVCSKVSGQLKHKIRVYMLIFGLSINQRRIGV